MDRDVEIEVRGDESEDAEEQRMLREIREKLRRGVALRLPEERLIRRLKSRGKLR